MRIQFKEVNFRDKSLRLLSYANQIIAAYQEAGYKLTLRQLYYQFVVRNIIENIERSYQNLGRLISEGRLAGLVDWSAIEDRIRVPWQHAEWNNATAGMDALLGQFRLPRWQDQPYHVEIWVEKDALAGVLRPIADRRHVRLLVNRGYSSQSAMYDAHERFRASIDEGKQAAILYLGDLDPSGEDMVRDIFDRLNEVFQVDVEVVKIGITPEQVAQYNPPPNPAKMSDSRAAGFVARHGYNSYEVDALPPEVLSQLLDDAIDQYEDTMLMLIMVEDEERHKQLLQDARDTIERLLREED